MLKFQSQSGFSLMEVLLGMALGVTSLAAIASLVGYGIGANAKLINGSRLNEELSVVANFVQRDIRRAGFNGNTVNFVTDPSANPSLFNASITLSEMAGETADSCVLYSYDENSDGVINTGATTNEAFGFRLNDEVIEWRSGEGDCNSIDWTPLTDPKMVEVEELLFQQQTINAQGIVAIEITFSIEAELEADSNISRRIERSVVVRNFEN